MWNSQNWRRKGSAAAAVAETKHLGTGLNLRGRVWVFPAEASNSQNEWEINFCRFSCTVLLATAKKQDSQHSDQATWQIHRPREGLLSWNYKLPHNEDSWAHRTPPAAAHTTSLTPFLVKEVWNYQVFLEQSFHPEARGVRAVCFILKPEESKLSVSSFHPLSPPTSFSTAEK